MARSRTLGLFGAFLLATGPAAGQAPHAVADGVTWEGALAGSVMVYRGIPYALAPTGARRWRPPEPMPTGAGVRPATTFGPACMQSDRLAGFTRGIAAVFGTADRIVPEPLTPSEDCLSLNVWTAGTGGVPAPVMVWIHGGSNINGTAASALYDGAALARRGVVVVTINYRLGVLGFMAQPALAAESARQSSGNYGLLDQLEALRWVRRNIRNFGGDPARVTVFGESAGSIDIVHLMASPLSRGLFHRAIAQSGAPMGGTPTREAAERYGSQIAKTVGADSAADPAAALRSVPADSLVRIQDRLAGFGVLPGVAIDGWVLTDHTGRIFERGDQAPVPLLIGTNGREMSTLRYYLPRVTQTPEGLREWVDRTFGNEAAKVAALYPAEGSVDLALVQLATDLYFTCPARMAARATARTSRNVYLYQFNRVLPGGESLGAFHSMELGYVFGVETAWLPWQPADRALSALMMDYWTRFAATGDPGGGKRIPWAAIGAGGRDDYLNFDARSEARTRLAADRCDAIEPAIRAEWR